MLPTDEIIKYYHRARRTDCRFEKEPCPLPPSFDSQAGQPALFLEILQKPAGVVDYSQNGPRSRKKRVARVSLRQSEKCMGDELEFGPYQAVGRGVGVRKAHLINTNIFLPGKGMMVERG